METDAAVNMPHDNLHDRRIAAAASVPLPHERSPFYYYNASFDPLNIIDRYARSDLVPKAGHFTNYLGVHIDTKFHPARLAGLEGVIEPPPVPANWHADIAEWGAALRAVDLSGSNFTMIELGCGWGCWMNITGAAARYTGRSVYLIGVEGDPNHIQFARESTATNGFEPGRVQLHHGVAAASAGTALFPNQEGGSWGLEPLFGAPTDQVERLLAAGTHAAMPMVPLAELASGHDRIDLLHVDIQGGEVDLVRGSLGVINAKIGYLLIGCHSRQIEGHLLDTLRSEGWILEIERPTIFNIHPDGGLVTAVDGVQGWKNPRI